MEANKTKSSTLFFFLLCMLWSSCSAFNITQLLNIESDFSIFNKYLSDTKLADQINNRTTVTVLAVTNDAMQGISSDDDRFVLKSAMSVHVILGYYDKEKLAKLANNNRSPTLTTLFQSSGGAQNHQGFVRVGIVNGEICFGSASKGGEMNSQLVRSVTAQPYNISVLEVSSIIRVPNNNAFPKKGKTPSPEDEDDRLFEDTAVSPLDDTWDENDEDEEDIAEEEAASPLKAKDSPPPKSSYDDVNLGKIAALSKGDARTTVNEMGVVGIVVIGVSVLVAFF